MDVAISFTMSVRAFSSVLLVMAISFSNAPGAFLRRMRKELVFPWTRGRMLNGIESIPF
jgi:hypothetical protein